jgi:Uncharacterised nucleotidyltransferase
VTLTDAERYLLEAACSTGKRALQAWGRWSASTDLDRLEPGEYALLPLVFRNLESQAPPGTPFRKAAAIYRQTWFANQIALRGAAKLGSALESRGIEYALAGSAALAVVAYPDPGARPIAGLDFLVGPERLREAIEASAGVELEEHAVRWHVQLMPGVTSRFAASLRAAAVPISVGGAALKVLAPADLFLIACERICTWDHGPRAPVLADAWQLLRALRSEAGWVHLQEQARAERVTLTLRAALSQLEALAAEPLPARVAKELGGTVPDLLERLECRCKRRAPGPVPGRGLTLLTLRHLRARAAGDRLARLAELPRLMLGYVAARLRERPLP